MRECEIVELGRMRYVDALTEQHKAADELKRGTGRNRLFFVEHPHVVTIGRNGRLENLLATDHVLDRSGIEFYESDRGGDVTYHGPGQLVGYPVIDLREWKRDVHAYVRAVEDVLINALSTFGIFAGREQGATGVWVGGKKIAAIGIHISRWVTTHGFALNIDTDLSYFQFIVPCGLQKPVCSLRSLGCMASHDEVKSAIVTSFAAAFDYEMKMDNQVLQEIA